MIRVGIVNTETWGFLRDLEPRLSSAFRTSVFERRETRAPVFRERLARRRLRRDLTAFLRAHDVVFFEWASELLALATRLPKACAIVTRLHRYELYEWANRVNWEAVDRVILVSEAKRRAFVGTYPSQAAKTVVVPVGVSIPRFSCAVRPFAGAIGTLCHLAPRKRVYDLILAFAEIAAAAPHLHLRVAGDPDPAHLDYHDAIQRLVVRLGLTGRVWFDGPVERPWEWYPTIDIFVSHSYSEGLQVAPMEAMAAGCYVLSHHWDGADELVPAECLYVTNAELARKVGAYCRLPDDERRARHLALQRLASDRFDVERSADRIVEIIDRCAAGVRAARPAVRGAIEEEADRSG